MHLWFCGLGVLPTPLLIFSKYHPTLQLSFSSNTKSNGYGFVTLHETQQYPVDAYVTSEVPEVFTAIFCFTEAHYIFVQFCILMWASIVTLDNWIKPLQRTTTTNQFLDNRKETLSKKHLQ